MITFKNIEEILLIYKKIYCTDIYLSYSFRVTINVEFIMNYPDNIPIIRICDYNPEYDKSIVIEEITNEKDFSLLLNSSLNKNNEIVMLLNDFINNSLSNISDSGILDKINMSDSLRLKLEEAILLKI
jgi:hypothetical protein